MDTSKLRELDRIRRLNASGNFREIKKAVEAYGENFEKDMEAMLADFHADKDVAYRMVKTLMEAIAEIEEKQTFTAYIKIKVEIQAGKDSDPEDVIDELWYDVSSQEPGVEVVGTEMIDFDLKED